MMVSARDNGEGSSKNRRAGHDRRRVEHTLPDGRNCAIQLLLARLIAVFTGTLIGFLAAYALSTQSIQPVSVLSAQAQEIVDNAVLELEGVTREFNTARQNFTPLEDELLRRGLIEDSARVITPIEEPQGDVAESDDVVTENDTEPINTALPETLPADEALADSASAETEVLVTDDSFDMEHYETARASYLRVKRQRQRLIDRRDFWQGEIAKHNRDIELLNLLGIIVVLVFMLIGYLLYPLWLKLLERLSLQFAELSHGVSGNASQATVGFFAGLVVAVVVILAVFSVLGDSNSMLSYGWFRLLFGAFTVVVLGMVGSLTGVAYFGPQHHDDPFINYRVPDAPKLLDSSVIIDSRVYEISTSGFLSGMLVVTNSVLRELQALADSADDRKRSKGRRGLELVRKMQDDPRLTIKVFDDASFDYQAKGTDEQLIVVAQAMDGFVVTNDYNLNRVAAIRNVRVININELANAVKTNHLPGDELDIEIMDRGKQRGQGVGYLDDGTMVVVEDGEPYIGKVKLIRLTSVSQTVQGRLLFGRVDLVSEDSGNGERQH